MFKYEKEYYDVIDEDDEYYYKVIFREFFGIFSPFEVDSNADFPKKDELGGVILKFIGGGAAYFKVQREIPGSDEVESVADICEFLRQSYGEYVLAQIICEPHIEIRDINLSHIDSNYITYTSSRKNDGDELLSTLISKIEKGEEMTVEEHILRVTLPFMSRLNEKEFQANYLKFCEMFKKSDMRLPDDEDLKNSSLLYNCIF